MTDATSQHLTTAIPSPAEALPSDRAIRSAAARARNAVTGARTRTDAALEAAKAWAARRSGIEPVLPEQAASERWMGGSSH